MQLRVSTAKPLWNIYVSLILFTFYVIIAAFKPQQELALSLPGAACIIKKVRNLPAKI